MAGYQRDMSMSNNAVAAYQEGKKPLSKWKKSEILNILREKIDEKSELFQELKTCSLEALKRGVLTCSEWHHTSGHFNKTDFYEVNIEKVIHSDLNDIKRWKTSAKNALKKSQEATPKRQGTIRYFEWEGEIGKKMTPIEKKLKNVLIDRKGCFFRVYDNDNNVILRKKVDGSGVHVEYNKTPEELAAIEEKRKKKEAERLARIEERKKRKAEKKRLKRLQKEQESS